MVTLPPTPRPCLLTTKHLFLFFRLGINSYSSQVAAALFRGCHIPLLATGPLSLLSDTHLATSE